MSDDERDWVGPHGERGLEEDNLYEVVTWGEHSEMVFDNMVEVTRRDYGQMDTQTETRLFCLTSRGRIYGR